MAARRAGGRRGREPERSDRRLWSAWAKARDRRAHGPARPALRWRFLVPGLPRHVIVRGRAARGRLAKNRTISGGEREQRPRRSWLRAYLLRKRRTSHGAGLSVFLALRLSARRLLPRPFELAPVAVRNPARRLDESRAALSRRHCARSAQ